MARESTTSREIIKKLSKASGITPKQAGDFLNTLLEEMKKELLLENKIQLKEFGTFAVKKWQSTETYNIVKGAKEKREIKTIYFKPAEKFKKQIKD